MAGMRRTQLFLMELAKNHLFHCLKDYLHRLSGYLVGVLAVGGRVFQPSGPSASIG